MADTIKPPIAADLDVRKFPFMPLDCKRLLHSDFLWSVNDAEFRAAILLWTSAWHQVPAGSLPNNDRTLATMCGFSRSDAGLAEFAAVKKGALYGFKLASDGRYYHPVIIERAIEAARRIAQFDADRISAKKRMAEKRAKEKSSGNQDVRKSYGVTSPDVRECSVLKETKTKTKTASTDRPEQRTSTPASPGEPGDGVGWAAAGPAEAAGEFPGFGATVAPEVPSALTGGPSSETSEGSPMKTGRKYPAAFEAFWLPYPRKVGKEAAFKAWTGAKKHTDPVVIASGAAKFATLVRKRGTLNDKIPYPATWLNAGRWMDDEATDEKANSVPWNQRPGNKMVF